MKTLMSVLLLNLLALSTGAQPLASDSTKLTGAELIRYVSASDFVVIGTVSAPSAIGKRLTEKESRELTDLGKTLGGYLYPIRVDTLLFARTDLQPGVNRPRLQGAHLLVFKKRDSRFFQEEVYQEGQQVLIFLTALPDQKALSKEYLLKGDKTYYEAFEGKKGLISISAERRPWLTRLQQLSEALRPADPKKKIERLQRLSAASDVDLKEGARAAIRIIETRMHR